jgi:hypothetical protein
MNARTLPGKIVAELREIPGALWREDSDPWEEIKEQVQEGLSFAWPAYVDTVKGVIGSAIAQLTPVELVALSSELKVPAGNVRRIEESLLRRFLAKARMENVRYVPFDFEYFWYSSSGITVYTQIKKRTGMHRCWILAYSGAAPFGEQGEIDISQIDRMTDIHIMTAEEFEEARSLNWPDRLQCNDG